MGNAQRICQYKSKENYLLKYEIRYNFFQGNLFIWLSANEAVERQWKEL